MNTRKRFFVPAEDVDKEAVLEFEGVYHDAEIYINEKKAAFRPYGYTNFYVELNEFLQYGAENTIRVIARNARSADAVVFEQEFTVR